MKNRTFKHFSSCAFALNFWNRQTLCKVVACVFENYFLGLVSKVFACPFHGVGDYDDWLFGLALLDYPVDQFLVSLGIVRASVIVIVQQFCQDLGHMLELELGLVGCNNLYAKHICLPSERSFFHEAFEGLKQIKLVCYSNKFFTVY